MYCDVYKPCLLKFVSRQNMDLDKEKDVNDSLSKNQSSHSPALWKKSAHHRGQDAISEAIYDGVDLAGDRKDTPHHRSENREMELHYILHEIIGQ